MVSGRPSCQPRSCHVFAHTQDGRSDGVVSGVVSQNQNCIVSGLRAGAGGTHQGGISHVLLIPRLTHARPAQALTRQPLLPVPQARPLRPAATTALRRCSFFVKKLAAWQS